MYDRYAEKGFDTFSSNSNLIIDNDEIFFVEVIGEYFK